MKYTILGFSQQKLVDLGLDLSDALIFRELLDFKATGKMVEREVNGKMMFWVKYSAIIAALPVLGIKTTDSIYRRMMKLVNAGLLNHETLKDGGSYSFFSFTPLSDEMLYQSDQKSDGVGSKVGGGTDEKSEQKTILTEDYSNKQTNVEAKASPERKIDQSKQALPAQAGIRNVPAEAVKLAETLAAHVLRINPKAKNLNTRNRDKTISSWAGHIDKINRLDGREWREIERVLNFANNDSFWNTNVLSGDSLRKQFDKLYVKAVPARKSTQQII